MLQKLRNLKKDISKWNGEVYGNIETQRTKDLLELGKLDQLDEFTILSPQVKAQSMNLKLQLQHIVVA